MLKPNWRESIQDIEIGLQRCVDALNNYENQFAHALNDQPPQLKPAQPDGFAEQLAMTGERANEMQRLLDEHEAIWKRFHSALGELKTTMTKG